MQTRVEISKRIILINSLSAVLGSLLSLCLVLWLHQYLLRRVTAEEYALYPVIVAVMMFIRILTSALTGGVARYIIEAYSKGDEGRVSEIVSSIMPPIAGASLILAAVGSFATWHLGSFLSLYPDQLLQARLMMGLMVFGMIFGLLSMPYTVGFHVRQKLVWLNLIQLGEQVLRIVLVVVLLFCVSIDVQWLVVGTVTSNVAATVVIVLGSRRLIPALRFERRRFRWQTMRTLLSFGTWSVLGMISHRLHVASDPIILNKLGTAVDVTAYHIGALLDRRFADLMGSLGHVLQPPLTAMHATGDKGGLQRAYLRGNRYFLWIAMLMAAPLIAFREELITLYVGTAYMDAALVILLLHLTYPMSYARRLLNPVAVAMGRVRGVMSALVFAEVLNVSVTICLVGSLQMGAIGAALGTLATSIVMNILLFWPLGLSMLRISFSTFLRETVVPGLIPGGVCLAACTILGQAVLVDSWLRLFACGALGVLAYLLVAWAYLRPEDRQDLRALMRRTWRRLPRGGATTSAEDQP